MKKVITTKLNIQNNIIIIGAGKVGQECYFMLKDSCYNICFFCDNDRNKQGKYIDNILIRSIESIRQMDSLSTTLIIAVNFLYEKEIEYQLMNMGILLQYVCIRFSQLCIPKLREYYLETKKSIQNICCESINKFDILYDHQAFMMQTNGGISRYFYEIIKRTKEQLTVDWFEGFNYNVYSKNALRVKKTEQYLLGYAELLNLSILHDFTKNKNYKIYHPTYYKGYGFEDAKTYVVTVHDMIHELYHMDKETIKNKKNMIKKADGIIAVSENTKKDLINIYDIDERNIQVIYHANSLQISCSEEPIIKGQYILYVGNRGGYKDAKTLVHAFANCRYYKDIKLVFFGGGEFTKEEKELFEEIGIVDYIEWQSGDDTILVNLYQYAELFVYPSLYEGFGIPILEAMHYGTPVITARSSSLTEIGGNAVAYFEPGSYESLAECIDCLLSDSSRRKELRQAGIKREKLFSWSKSAKEHINFYRKFL